MQLKLLKLIFILVAFVVTTFSQSAQQNQKFIYSRSFADSEGDLRGITTKLQYLREIGMNTI